MATYQNSTPTYDAQSYQFKPYELPSQAILQTVQQKTNYWLEGASQINSKWQKALNLDVTTGQSKQFLESELTKVDEQIKATVGKDLSISDNVNKVTNLFNPIFNNKKVMMDNQLTEFYKQQHQLSEQYKTKDGGKQYSDINVRYMQDHANDFSQHGDWDNIEEFYNKRKGYVPYHDYTREYKDVMATCKGDSASKATQQGLFVATETDKSRTADDILGCLQSGLSANALNQMNIEGAVRYRTYDAKGNRDYTTLASDYIMNGRSQQEKYSNKITAINSSLSAKGNSLTKEQTDFLTAQKKDLTSALTNIQDGLQQVENGDYSLLQNNYDQIAGNTWSTRVLGKTAADFAYTDYKLELDTNVPQLEILKQNRQDLRLLQTQQGAKELENLKFQHEEYLKAMYGGGTGDGKSPTTLEAQLRASAGMGTTQDFLTSLPPAIEGSRQTSIYEDVMNQQGNIEKQLLAKNDYLVKKVQDYVKTTNPDDEILKVQGDGPYFRKWFETFYKNLPDGAFKQDLAENYFKPTSKLAFQQAVIANSLTSAEAEIRRNNPELFDRSRLNNISPTVVNGRQITANEIQDAIEGKNPTIKITKRPTGFPGRDWIDFTINGTPLEKGSQQAINLNALYENVAVKNFKNTKTFNEERERLLKLDETIQTPVFNPASLNSDKSPNKLALASRLGINPDRITFEGTTLGGNSVETGNTTVRIRSANEGELKNAAEDPFITRDIDFNELNKAIGGNAKKINTDGSFDIYIKDFDISDPNSLYDAQRLFVKRATNSLMRNPTSTSYEMPSQQGDNGNAYRVSIKKFGNEIEYQVQQSLGGANIYQTVNTFRDDKQAMDSLQKWITLKKGQTINAR